MRRAIQTVERVTRTSTRVERLHAQASSEAKALFQKAASIQGSSMTDFVVNSALDAAKRSIHETNLSS
jgi:uncharacterized protein (DUF1778 family)